MQITRAAILPTLMAATLGQLVSAQVVATSGEAAAGPAGRFYDIDTQTGACSAVGSTNHPYLSGLALNPATNTIYGCSQDNDLFTLDRITGAATLVGAIGVSGEMHGMAWDTAAGTLYGVSASSSGELVTIDPATGVGSVVGSLGIGPVNGLAYAPNTSTLFGYVSVSDQLVSIDSATGAATVIGVVGTARGGLQGLSFDRQSGTLVGPDDDSGQLYRIDPATGIGTAVGLLTGATEGLRAVAPAPAVFAGLFAAAHSHDTDPSIFTIDTATGASTLQLPVGMKPVSGLAFDPETNRLYGAVLADRIDDDSTIHVIDPASGVMEPVPVFTAPGHVGSLTFDTTNNMIYGTTLSFYPWMFNDFFGFDPATGYAYLGPLVPDSVTGLAFASDTNTVYGYAATTDELVTIDPTNIASTVVGTVGTGADSITGLSFDAASGLLYGTNHSTKELVIIDRATGAGTTVSTYDAALNIYAMAPTPETNPPATVSSLGTACADISRAFRFVPNPSGGYDVVDADDAAFDPNIGVLAGATDDDQITATNLDLGFTFPFPAAAGAAPEQFVRIDPNGRILPESSSLLIGDFLPSVIDLTSHGYPMVCPFWCDFDVTHPDSGGIYWTTEPGLARFTWNNVSQYGPGQAGTAITVQCTLFENGEVLVVLEDIVGFNTSQNVDELIIAVASGSGGANPPELDLSAITNGPTQSSSVPAYEHFAVGESDLTHTSPELRAVTRPVMGSTFTYEITNAPVAVTAGFYLIGFETPAAPIPLTLLGIPCSLNVNVLDVQTVLPSATPGTMLAQGIPIPSMPTSLVGVEVYVQGITDGAPFASPFFLTNTIVGTVSDH